MGFASPGRCLRAVLLFYKPDSPSLLLPAAGVIDIDNRISVKEFSSPPLRPQDFFPLPFEEGPSFSPDRFLFSSPQRIIASPFLNRLPRLQTTAPVTSRRSIFSEMKTLLPPPLSIRVRPSPLPETNSDLLGLGKVFFLARPLFFFKSPPPLSFSSALRNSPL